MSENMRETRPHFGFLSFVGLLTLIVSAVLVALYFYNADVRSASEGVVDQARAYQRTIATDYARFYECVRGGAPAQAVQTLHADSGSATPPREFKPEPATPPLVVYPPYADYPAYPGAAPVMPAESEPQPGGPPQNSPQFPQQAMLDSAGTASMPAGESQGMPGGESQSMPSMQPGPIMQTEPTVPPALVSLAGPMDSSAPAFSPPPQESAAVGRHMPPQADSGMPPAMSGQSANAGRGGQGTWAYGPPPGWQGRMAPSYGLPAGMAAPMPHAQGPNMESAYGAPQRPANPYGYAYGPNSYPPAPPQYNYVPSAGHPVPAMPTLPPTSMMPPPGDTPPALPAVSSAQPDALILAARQAFAAQQHQESINMYRTYVARTSADASAYGELGNVLLAAGRPQEAAQAYYEASSRLIDAGEPGTVYLLLPHIEQQDPLLGAVLMRRLASLPRSIY